MRIATIATLFCVAGALSGCGSDSWFSSGGSSSTAVEFVSANADSVLLDFNALSKTALSAATDTATQECALFHRGPANLEALNVRVPGTIRATFTCGK